MIRFIIDSTMSKSDVYGNSYGFTKVTSTKTGSSLYVYTGLRGAGGNIKSLLHNNAFEWDELYSVVTEVKIREWEQQKKNIMLLIYEHKLTIEMILQLEG